MRESNVAEVAMSSISVQVPTEEGIRTDISSLNVNLNDEVTLLSNNISDAIMHLSTTITSLHSSTSTTLGQAIFIVFMAAFSAYVFNLLHWMMVNKKQKKAGITTALSKLVDELELLSVTYWLDNYDEKRKLEIRTTEITIKPKIRLIVRYIKILSAALNSRKSASEIKKLDDFGNDIFELVTGGEFESICRIASPKKAIDISTKCSDVKAMISSFGF